MSKKVIGALLAIVMVLSVFSLTALAAGAYDWENDEDAKHHKQTWGLSTVEGNKINVILSTTYEVGPISFKIKDIKSLDDVKLGAGYYQGSDVQFNKTTGQVLIMPPVANTALEGKKLNNAVVATFTYTPSEGKVPAIDEDPKLNTVDHMNGTLIASRLTSKYVASADYLIGQTCFVTALDEEPAPVPPTEGADLALKSGVTGVVIDTAKTFGGAYAGAVYGIPRADGGASKITSSDIYTSLVEATNGGSIVVSKSIYSGRGASWGTGTEIEVKNSDGTTSKKYVVVLFGDIDGNGTVDTADLGLVLSETKAASLPEIKRLAANCYIKIRANVAQGLHDVDTLDLGVVLAQTKSYSELDFAAIAAKHVQYNEYYQ